MRVAVTGCASDFGTVLLPRLFDDPGVEEVLGIDLREPRVAHDKLRFEQEDVRSPRLRELFAGFDAVVHLAFVVAEIHDKDLTHDVNWGGSRNVIESAATAGTKRLVMASSVAAYGAHPGRPGRLTEDEFPRGNHDKYYFYDKAEVEHFVEWWNARNPDAGMTITMLRPPFIAGPHFSNSAIDSFSSPVGLLPGSQAQFQLLHEDDLADAFHRVTVADHPGAFNVAPADEMGPGEVGEIHAQRAVRVPLPVARVAAEALFRVRLSPASADWVVSGESTMDASRLRAATGWEPRLTSRETAHVMLLQNGRPILKTRGELHRREVAEAALRPMTELMRRWCGEIEGLKEATGGPDAYDGMIERAEHVYLPFRTGELHAEVHPADDASAPSIVFSPGIGGYARFYSPALGALRNAGFNVLGVDRPGHGLSMGRRGHATVPVVLDALETVVRHARERFGGPVVLGGSSLGGIFSWYALTREPDVDAVFSHNINHPEIRHEPAMRVKVPALKRLARLAPRAPVPIKQIADFDAVSVEPAVLRYFEEAWDKLWSWTITARSAASLFEFDRIRDWSEVDTPALVLVGAQDTMVTPEHTRASFERSHPRGAELRELPGAPHAIFHDHLPLALKHVSAFVREHTAAPVVA